MSNKICDVLRWSIEDVCLDQHLELDIEETAKKLMKLTEFDSLVHAFKTKPLEDETEELQEAIWACYDFAEEKIKEKIGEL